MGKNGFLGIDVSKGYADLLLLDHNKQVIESAFRLQDDQKGRKQLRHLIDQWFANGLEQLYCGVESTGGYENNWYRFLAGLSQALPLKVARLNAKGVKSVGDAALKRTITDAVSAENIAVYLIHFSDKVHYYQKPERHVTAFSEGRQHYTYIRMLIKQKVQLGNQLEKLLYQHFPEILVYCRNGIPCWLLGMLIKYSSATAVKKAGETRLAGIKGISLAKARALLQKTAESDQTVSKHVQHVIATTAREILHKEDLIKEEKQYLVDIYKDDALVKLLVTIPCVGIETAVLLTLEIENINRFASAKKLASYFGVHPTYKQSGDGLWQVGMSKKGRGDIRAALYMAGLTGLRFNSILRQLYARFRAQGMKHYQAMGVVMHKLLRIIFGVLKNKTTFDPAIDETNTEASKEKQQKLEQQKKETAKQENKKLHRYQERTIEGPISRRTAKRIKQITS
jgi:transposase